MLRTGCPALDLSIATRHCLSLCVSLLWRDHGERLVWRDCRRLRGSSSVVAARYIFLHSSVVFNVSREGGRRAF